MFSPNASHNRPGNLVFGSSLCWHAHIGCYLLPEVKEKIIENTVITCEASFFLSWRRAIKYQSELTLRRPYSVALSVSPVGQSTTGSAEGQSGLRVSQSRTLARLSVFSRQWVLTVRIPYTHNTVKFVPTLPQWRSVSASLGQKQAWKRPHARSDKNHVLQWAQDSFFF